MAVVLPVKDSKDEYSAGTTLASRSLTMRPSTMPPLALSQYSTSSMPDVLTALAAWRRFSTSATRARDSMLVDESPSQEQALPPC